MRFGFVDCTKGPDEPLKVDHDAPLRAHSYRERQMVILSFKLLSEIDSH